jgi:putative tryptophan/tyrosine transport system substrate-binding protein
MTGGAALAGTAATWPLVLRAQPKAMPVIGYLNIGTPPKDAARVALVAAYGLGLGESGYVEGQNATIEYRYAEGRRDRLPAMAADLVDRKVDVIVTVGGIDAARAAKWATSTTPIVFIGVDPVASGLVANLARPGGNLTGVSSLTVDLYPKRLELLRDLVPQATVIALLVNPSTESTDRVLQDVQAAARAKGMQLLILKAGSEREIDAAFVSLVERHCGALVVMTDLLFFDRRQQIAALAERHAVPAIYPWREFATAGGFISYGASLRANFRQAGAYTGRILKGEKPADLPVVEPATFELIINMKTAKALGLTIPPSILARADEVIE